MDKSLTFYESMKYEEFIMGSGHNFIRPDFTTYVFPVSKSSQNSIADSYFTVRTSSAFHIHFSLHKKIYADTYLRSNFFSFVFERN